MRGCAARVLPDKNIMVRSGRSALPGKGGLHAGLHDFKRWVANKDLVELELRTYLSFMNL